MKSLWEKCDEMNISIAFQDIPLDLPWEGDKWLMGEFIRLGYSEEQLRRLNRVRIYQQVIYLSEVLSASGKQLDQKYLCKRPQGAMWSKLNFPKESPPNKDFALWTSALHQVAPGGGIQDRLGPLNHIGYKVWEWRLDEENARLLHYHFEGMDIYHKSQHRYRNRWTRVLVNQLAEYKGVICSIREVGTAVVAITPSTPAPRPKDIPTTFMDVLIDWGSTWMWDSLRLIGEED